MSYAPLIFCAFTLFVLFVDSRYNVHKTENKVRQCTGIAFKGIQTHDYSRSLDWHWGERKEMGGSGNTDATTPFCLVCFSLFKAEPLLPIARLKYTIYCCTVQIKPLRAAQVCLVVVYS